MGNFILVTGGARSGKSSFAEQLAKQAGPPVTYIATAQVWDEEMALRVQKHRLARPAEWKLVEEPMYIKETLYALREEQGVILLDCVTLWLSNLLLAPSAHSTDSNGNLTDHSNPGSIASREEWVLAQVREVAALARQIRPTVIFVTNEVGQGIVPENALARAYRDIAGRSNQILAQAAAKVYWVICGYPLEIKQSGQQLLDSVSWEE